MVLDHRHLKLVLKNMQDIQSVCNDSNYILPGGVFSRRYSDGSHEIFMDKYCHYEYKFAGEYA